MKSTLREAVRQLLRTPGFTAFAVLSLGIGVGLVTSVAAVVRAAFFAPLPYPDADRLIAVWSTQRPGSDQPVDYLYPERAEEWIRTEMRTVASLAAGKSEREMVLGVHSEGGGSGQDETVTVEPILGDWFGVLGVAAERGRVLTRADLGPEAGPAAVVSHDLWQSRFSGSEGILGTTIRLSGVPFTVVGVMPEGYRSGRRIWVAAGALSEDLRPNAYLGVGRLRDGASLQDASRELGRLAAAQVVADSARWGGYGATAIPLSESERGGMSGTVLWIVAGVVGVVFLMGVSNLTNLFLVRAQRRSRDLAVRASLGAGGWHLGKGLATEGLLVGLGGGAFGLMLATWGKDAIRILALAGYALPVEPVLGLSAAASAVGLGLAVSILVALEPLRRVGSLDVASLLHGRAAGGMGTKKERRLRDVLVAGQVGGSVVLVALCGLFVLSYRSYRSIDMGYDAERVVQAVPDYATAGVEADAQWELGRTLADRLRRRPEVEGVALWRAHSPPWPPRPEYEVRVQGVERQLDTWESVLNYHVIEPGSLQALGIPLLHGRSFSDEDDAGAPFVGIVSEGLARAWWPDADPLGRQFKMGRDEQWVTVVGVVADAQLLGPTFARAIATRRHWPLVFIPSRQASLAPASWAPPSALIQGVSVGIRASHDPNAVARAFREELGALAPDLPVESLGTMVDLQMEDYTGSRLTLAGRLLAVGSFVGLLLAVLGIVGIVADGVHRRTREIGVRIALGARKWAVLLAIGRESLVTALVGGGAGFVAVAVLREVLPSIYFFRTTVGDAASAITDPRLIAGTVMAVGVVTLVATFGAARKALGVDPAEALRLE